MRQYIVATALGTACLVGLLILFYSRKRKPNSIIQKLELIMSEITDLKDKVVAQSAALDTVSTNVSGIASDVAFLKQKIADLEGGASAEEVAELKVAIDAASEKIASISEATSSLDAETDSTVTPE